MKISWIAADWGTTNLRLWAMDDEHTVIDEKQTNEGVNTLTSNTFESVLCHHLKNWIKNEDQALPVIACGMIGSRQGLLETPYSVLPCRHLVKSYALPTNPKGMEVHIITGIAQHTPPDVMRGEETQIAGFLAHHSKFNGILCIAGTHTKWIILQNGNIKKFHTFLTGELFALLSQQSLLRHSLGTWRDDAFVASVSETLQHPEKFSQYLFTLRAANLLHDEENAIAKLSGILIGIELASMQALFGTLPIVVIGTEQHLRNYELALAQCGIQALMYAQSVCTQEGLKIAYHLVMSEGNET